ncbi:dual specificity protein phosphatase domain-containing protein [Artemisia annua]|uniref:protein-tyrosine-phosphatase n=1 Tax=Artemisia annua TaxID=35608 RepID=A0A2U1QLY9_ARTAN|nr:dual specificity protein phosphatase domain-containing protein [Artemisia annua]
MGMLYVRENLFLGDINAASEVLLGNGGSKEEITHILSVLSKPSIGFFTELKPTFFVPTKEIRTVYMGSDKKKIHYVLENSGHDLKLVRMAVPLTDSEGSNLLDYLEVSLDFIDQARKNGSVLVHCFAGLSRSASIMTAYLMRSERLSVQDALASLRQSKPSVCPNDGFLEQLTMFQDMGFKVDHSSPIYKRFLWKVLGPRALLSSWVLDVTNSLWRKMSRVMLSTPDCEALSQAPGESCNRGERIDSSNFNFDRN